MEKAKMEISTGNGKGTRLIKKKKKKEGGGEVIRKER